MATRIIPTVLNKNGALVKGRQFDCARIVGHAYQASKVYGMRNVDELVLLDVMASKEGRPPDYEGIARLADNFFVPLTVGGGVKSIFHVKQLLRSGADKVAVMSGAIQNPDLLCEIADRFGSSTLTACIDVPSLSGSPLIHWAVETAMDYERRGAGEILLQSVQRDGTLQGYELELLDSVVKNVNVPVVISGGCAGYEDMFQAIELGASAVAASALFLFTDATPKGAAEYLRQKGVEVRL